MKWFQERMQTHGFLVPQHGELDRATRDVIAAFQMKYRPLATTVNRTPRLRHWWTR